jgi:hypothetical protein
MPANDGRAVRRAFVLTIATALTAGMALTVSPTVAQPLPAIEQFAVSAGDGFPADAFNGERTALASDALLLTDPKTGLSLKRLSNASGTELLGDVRGDAAVPVFAGRERINKIAVTGAGTITAPFEERSLSLSLVGDDYATVGPILQLTSPSDAAEIHDGYTALGPATERPIDGRTYVLLPEADAAGDNPDGLAAMTMTPDDVYATNLASLGATDQLSHAQQWTVDVGGATADGPWFQLINRNDGTCLTNSAEYPKAGLTDAAVCDTVERRLRRMARCIHRRHRPMATYRVGARVVEGT